MLAFCRDIPSHEKIPIPKEKSRKNPETQKIKNPILRFLGFFTRDFFGNYEIPIPITGISAYSAYFDLVQNNKIRELEKAEYRG